MCFQFVISSNVQSGLQCKDTLSAARTEHNDTTRSWLDFQPLWSQQLKLKKITMMTAGQMEFGMNTAKLQQDDEYDKATEDFGQAHLAQQNTTNSDCSPSNNKML